jgi:hypothetical protein
MTLFGRVVAATFLVSSALLSGYANDHCNEQLFGGFDGRLTVEPIGQAPIKGDTVLGFEVIREVPIVALPHRIIALSKADTLAWTSLDKVSHIAVDGNEKLFVQTTKAILTPHGKSLASMNDLGKVVGGELFNSGNPNALSLTKDQPGRWTITGIRPDASLGSSLQLQDPVRALSWNKVGLSLVAGSTLMVVPEGTAKLSFLGADRGFEKAQDTCLVGPDRAVIALPNTVLLITRKTATLLVSMSARVRCAGDTLYLLDLRSGIVAKVSGLDQLGDKDSDEQYAKALISALPKGTAENNAKFLEAARILGCTRAREVAGGRLEVRK